MEGRVELLEVFSQGGEDGCVLASKLNVSDAQAVRGCKCGRGFAMRLQIGIRKLELDSELMPSIFLVWRSTGYVPRTYCTVGGDRGRR